MTDSPATPPRTSLVDQLGVSLWRALTAWEDEINARAADRGFADVSAVDSEVLIWLPPQGLSISDLARRRGVTKQAMQQAVGGLVARGYVALDADPDDRRVRLVRYTDRGRAYVDALREIRVELQVEAESRLGTHKALSLTGDLTRLAALWPDRQDGA